MHNWLSNNLENKSGMNVPKSTPNTAHTTTQSTPGVKTTVLIYITLMTVARPSVKTFN